MTATGGQPFDMHGIELLPSGRFRVRFIRKGRSVSNVVATIDEAVGLRDALREELTSGEVIPLEGLSVAVWGKTWLAEFRSTNRGYKTERGRFQMHIATAEWARKPLQAVEPPDAITWLLSLQKTNAMRNGKRLKHTLSFQSRKHLRNLATALFADAVGMGLCKTNPFTGIKVKKTSSDRLVERIPEEWPLKPAEQKTAAEVTEGDPERWIVQFAMGAGLRQGELWNLHLEDVHVDPDQSEGPWVNVRFGSKGKPPKNGRPRKVPLFGMALEAAREWLKILPAYAPLNPERLMFPTPARAKQKKSGGRAYKGGARRQVGKTPRAWTRIKEALGERKLWWHLLRHTCATSLLCGWWGRRWSLEEVSKMLGHSSVKVTERYAHLLESALANIAAESHAWWLSRRSSGGSDGSSGSTPAPSSGGASPSENPSEAGAAASASEGDDLFHGFSMSGSAVGEILNDLSGTPERIRTSDLRLRRPSLYPAELRAQKHEVRSYRRS
jgi:integrase